MTRIYTALLLVFFLPVLCMAQESAEIPRWSGFSIDGAFIAGKVYKHEAKFTLPIPKISTGIDVNFIQHTYGRKDWEQRRRYPTVGVGFTYIDYGMDAVYGRGIGMYPNITVPLFSSARAEWTIRAGDGIGYLTRRYSRADPVDTVNVAIGSHINDFFMCMTALKYHLNNHWSLSAGANFTHFSDASVRKPNLGINMYGANVGLQYSPVTSRPTHIHRQLKPLRDRWLFEFRATIAFESAYVPGGPLYPTYLGTAYVSKRWISKNKAFAGIDYSYHEGIYAYLRNNGLDVGQEVAHAYKSAVFAGNEFLLGRVGLVVQLGYYLQQSALPLGTFYEKVGGNFYIVKRETGPIKEFFLCAFVKSHGIVAELGEAGVGIGF